MRLTVLLLKRLAQNTPPIEICSRPAWTARARTSRAPALPDRGFGFPTAPPVPDEIVPWSPAVAAQPNPAAGQRRPPSQQPLRAPSTLARSRPEDAGGV